MHQKIRTLTTAAATAALLSLAACGTQPSQTGSMQSSYPPSTGSTASNTSGTTMAQYGVVQSIDLVQQENKSGIGAGAIVGAVVGGVLGNQVGKGDGKTAATVLGAAGGAYAGNEVQKRNQPQQADSVRMQVRLNSGAQISVTQESASDIRVGDRVVVQNGVARRY